jgi:hypothetical protein
VLFILFLTTLIRWSSILVTSVLSVYGFNKHKNENVVNSHIGGNVLFVLLYRNSMEQKLRFTHVCYRFGNRQPTDRILRLVHSDHTLTPLLLRFFAYFPQFWKKKQHWNKLVGSTTLLSVCLYVYLPNAVGQRLSKHIPAA